MAGQGKVRFPTTSHLSMGSRQQSASLCRGIAYRVRRGGVGLGLAR